jgi:hopene-associated glycosyltransferase HpnB
MTDVLAAICVAVWIYLICARGQFWRARAIDLPVQTRVSSWPAVAVVVPARNESVLIAQSLQSLLQQDYQGALSIIVVDDDSNDGTAVMALHAARQRPDRQVTVVTSNGPPAGWTGKLWALREGIAAAERSRADYVLLTDADIVHKADTLSWLVANSLAGGFVLTSLMAKLSCKTLVERIHMPAFVYFFQMLFPFLWVCQARSSVAAAAGGCMLIRADALALAGGVASIRNSQIDDCTLAARLKRVGPIWLGLTNRVRSIRQCRTLSDVKQMISRSAYAQLRYSPLLLAVAALGMAVTFIIPPLLVIFATGLPRYLGLAAWLAMAVSFVPMLRFYRLSPLWCAALPCIASLYLTYTFDSAYQHLRQRGGRWKGRVYVDQPGLS